MAEQKSPEERMAAWWAGWRKEDYSWAGLENKPWEGWVVAPDGAIVEAEGAPEGSRPATLQDYWREEAPHLIEGDGGRWTRVHCPLAWADGSPTPKAGWSDAERAAFAALLSARLGAAAETKFGGDWYAQKIVGADKRAQFQGVVHFGAPTHPQGKASLLSARFDFALFSENTGFGDASFSGNAQFLSAAFAGEASFSRASFGDHASFENCTFFRHSGFGGAIFGREGYFGRCAFLSQGDFDDAKFLNNADFNNVEFEGGASFLNTTFCGYANFTNAAFFGVGRFNNASFSGDSSFSNVAFSDVHFDQASFVGTASFRRTTFSGTAMFDGAAFSEDAHFLNAGFGKNARFNRVLWSGDAIFYRSTFAEDAYFEQAVFAGDVRFDDGEFGRAYFTKSKAMKAFSARARSFLEFSRFDEMSFEGDMDFSNAIFEKAVSFERIAWPTAAGDWHCAFDQALFRSTAEFTGAGLRALAAFDGALLECGIKIDDPRESIARKAFGSELHAATHSARPDAEKWIEEEQRRRMQGLTLDWRVETLRRFERTVRITDRSIRLKRAEARENRLKELERGCRVLKQAMEYSSNKTRELNRAGNLGGIRV